MKDGLNFASPPNGPLLTCGTGEMEIAERNFGAARSSTVAEVAAVLLDVADMRAPVCVSFSRFVETAGVTANEVDGPTPKCAKKRKHRIVLGDGRKVPAKYF